MTVDEVMAAVPVGEFLGAREIWRRVDRHSLNTIRRYLGELVAAKLIERQERPWPGHPGQVQYIYRKAEP